MWANFKEYLNIQGKGGVRAANSTNYKSHYLQDAAIAMHTLQIVNPGSWNDIKKAVESYAQFVVHNQAETPNPGCDIRAEPRFELPDGAVYTKKWNRPQNAGAALR